MLLIYFSFFEKLEKSGKKGRQVSTVWLYSRFRVGHRNKKLKLIKKKLKSCT